MTGVPPAALAAARAAVPFVNRDACRRILEAGAPGIEAAERERIIALAEHHRIRVDMGPFTSSVPFADLLREQP